MQDLLSNPCSLGRWLALCFFSMAMASCGPDITFDEEARPLLDAYDPNPSAGSDTTSNTTADAEPLDALGHGAWDAVVERFVVGRCFDYDGLAASSEARALLQLYTNQLGRVNRSAPMDRDARMALWINAYNALTISGVLSEREQDPEFRVDRDDFRFFKVQRFNVGGLLLALDHIEHGILRRDLNHPTVQEISDPVLLAAIETEANAIEEVDPRLHFAVNCASVSCPALRPSAYQGAELEQQLAEQSTLFLDDLGRGAGPDGISSLFQWFESDFLMEAPIPDFIATYRTDGIADVDTSRYLTYDWSLNAYDPNGSACQP